MSEHNEWELSSGLSLDGQTVAVTSMEFGFNANIGANVLCANFTFTDDEGEEHEQSFSVGKGWDASRDGTELVSTNGRSKGINGSTNFGILIASAVECLNGDGEKLGGSPRHASTWLGSKWDMGTIKVHRVNPTTGAESDKDVFVFTGFHGAGDGEAAAKPKPSKAAAKPTATGNTDIDPELWDALVSLAGEHSNHDDFVEAAMDLEGVEGSKAAQKAVISTKAGSPWAAK